MLPRLPEARRPSAAAPFPFLPRGKSCDALFRVTRPRPCLALRAAAFRSEGSLWRRGAQRRPPAVRVAPAPPGSARGDGVSDAGPLPRGDVEAAARAGSAPCAARAVADGLDSGSARRGPLASPAAPSGPGAAVSPGLVSSGACGRRAGRRGSPGAHLRLSDRKALGDGLERRKSEQS